MINQILNLIGNNFLDISIAIIVIWLLGKNWKWIKEKAGKGVNYFKGTMKKQEDLKVSHTNDNSQTRKEGDKTELN